MLNFQGAVYIKNGFCLKIIPLGGSILNVNPGSVLIINQQKIEIQVNETEKVVTIVLPEIEVHDLTVDMGTLDCIFVKEKYNTEEVSEEAYAASKADLQKRIEEDNELFDLAKKNTIESVKALFVPWIEQVDEEYIVEVY